MSNKFENPETVPSEEEPIEQSLLDQFDHPEEIEFGGKKIDITDISPERLKTETPTLVVPGFTANAQAFKDSIIRTAEAGRRVISVDAPHGIETEKGGPLPEVEMRKMELLLQLLEKKGIGKVNIIAHSEGAIYVTAAAILHPEKFENIVLIEPAGIIGQDGFFKLLKRFVEDTAEQFRQDKKKKKVKYASTVVGGANAVFSDFLASVKEVKAITESDITPALEEIHKAGIGVSIIHAVDDKIFPMEKAQKMVKAKMIDGFYSVSGTHNSIYLYEPFGRAAEAALSALENKKNKKES